jgi:7-carboxy-7-deazaguanine synthase
MSDLDKLPINEIFETIQGEATWTGTPSIFVRLQGCPVGCPWCDTKHTWVVSRDRKVDVDVMLRKELDLDTFAFMTPLDIVSLIRERFRARHIVITGGEPCLYDLTDLTSLILEQGWTVQIETSGTHVVMADLGTFVTVSPKIGMPGGLKVLKGVLARADEIKMPIGKETDVAKLAALLDEINARPKHHVWLQPLSQNHKATKLCIEAATANGWRLSMQTHKYLGVR